MSEAIIPSKKDITNGDRVNGTPSPLVSSEMGFVEVLERLKARAAYAQGAGR